MKKTIPLLFILFAFSLYAQSIDEFEFLLSGSTVTDITSDANSVWIATNGSGIFNYSIDDNKWTQYSTSRGNLQHDFFYSIAVGEGFVWAGSIDGLFIFDIRRNNWTKRKFALGGQLANWIRSLSFDKYDKSLWIGRFKYLTKYDMQSRRFTDYDLTINRNEKTNTIKTIKVDGDSLVWFGTEAGLHKYNKLRDINDPRAITFYDNRLNYFNGEGEQVSISALLFERSYIWIGLDEFVTQDRPEFNVGGLFRFNHRNEWIRFDNSRGLTGNGISALERTGNYIWAALYQFGKNTKEIYGRGLVLIDRLTNRVIPINNENIPQSINTIYFDGTHLWIGSNNGLLKINFFNKLAQWTGGTQQ